MTCSKPHAMSSQNVRVHLPTPSPPRPVAGHRHREAGYAWCTTSVPCDLHTWRYGAGQCRTPPPPLAQNMIGITLRPQALTGELWSRSWGPLPCV